MNGNYYFSNGKVQPYAAFGAGTIISGKSAAPTLNLGGGAHFFVAENVSVFVQALYKTAFIHHRAEGKLGVGFHF